MPITEQLVAMNADRCRRVVKQDYQRLRELLSHSLIRNRTRGHVDTRKNYLVFVSGVNESLKLRRKRLHMLPLGCTTAVMHRKQLLRMRRRGYAEEVIVEAMVTQVTACEANGQCRVIAFHSTPFGAPPHAMPHRSSSRE